MPFVHGENCNSITFPMKCPRCAEKVFFFQCDCGSRVFFDDLGRPWPIHDCDTSWTRNLIRQRGDDGSTVVILSEGVTVRRAPESFRVSEAVTSGTSKPRWQDSPIEAIDPQKAGDARTVIGFVREKRPVRDVHKTYGMEPGTMGGAMLSPLSDGKWGKITIHEPNDGKLHSYTFWVRTEDIDQAGNDKGVTARASLEALNIPRGEPVWVCTEYEVFG